MCVHLCRYAYIYIYAYMLMYVNVSTDEYIDVVSVFKLRANLCVIRKCIWRYNKLDVDVDVDVYIHIWSGCLVFKRHLRAVEPLDLGDAYLEGQGSISLLDEAPKTKQTEGSYILVQRPKTGVVREWIAGSPCLREVFSQY